MQYGIHPEEASQPREQTFHKSGRAVSDFGV
jgi:hypothetical protein